MYSVTSLFCETPLLPLLPLPIIIAILNPLYSIIVAGLFPGILACGSNLWGLLRNCWPADRSFRCYAEDDDDADDDHDDDDDDVYDEMMMRTILVILRSSGFLCWS